MMGHSASVLLALATMAAAEGKQMRNVSHGPWAVGQKFEIETADQIYRGQLLDRASGQCLVTTSSDGTRFSVPRKVYLLGATAGQQADQTLVLMHEIKVGLRMELGIDDLDQKHRQITSEVKAIRLDD